MNHSRDCLLSRQGYLATLPTPHKRCFFFLIYVKNSKTRPLSLNTPCFLQGEKGQHVEPVHSFYVRSERNGKE